MDDKNLVTENENDDYTPHMLHFYAQAELLYMGGLENIGEITALLKGNIDSERLARWMEQNKWEEKKKKVGEIKTALYKDARKLVNTTLAIARVVPSVNTISSYKRALESFVLLKKIIPPKKNKHGAVITPEHIKEFADAAGLSYTDVLPGNTITDDIYKETKTDPVNETELPGEDITTPGNNNEYENTPE